MIIGVLGGIGAGKSTVVRLLSEEAPRRLAPCGQPQRAIVTVIDADALAHQALETKATGKQLRERFGPEVFSADGRADRQALAQRVFTDQEQLQQLEAIVHTVVRSAIRSQLDAFREQSADDEPERGGVARLCILDVPLLASSPLRDECDEILFVDTDWSVRESRVIERRSWAPGELERRERYQVPLAEKRAMANAVVDNSKGEEATREQVIDYLDRLAQPGKTDPTSECAREAASEAHSQTRFKTDAERGKSN